jgi:hypothetical protein
MINPYLGKYGNFETPDNWIFPGFIRIVHFGACVLFPKLVTMHVVFQTSMTEELTPFPTSKA